MDVMILYNVTIVQQHLCVGDIVLCMNTEMSFVSPSACHMEMS